MLAVNYSTLRNNLKAYCDKATDESETVIVRRKNEKNVINSGYHTYRCLCAVPAVCSFESVRILSCT